jgi:hypothetical protein
MGNGMAGFTSQSKGKKKKDPNISANSLILPLLVKLCTYLIHKTLIRAGKFF